MSKLVDWGSNKDFIKCPKTKTCRLALCHLDAEKLVKRVKFIKGTSPSDGQEWQKLLDDGRGITLEQGFMEMNFSQERFIDECKKLGDDKFVLILTRLLRSSLIDIIPSLYSEGAPPVKYIQGDTNNCVFKSLASTFHGTRIPLLMQKQTYLWEGQNNFLVGLLHVQSQGSCWRACLVASMKDAQKSFDWEKDMMKACLCLPS